MPRRKPPQPIDELLPRLTDIGFRVRADAARALGESRNPDAVAPLIPLLRDKRVTVREMTAIALGKLGGPTALDALAAALADTNHHVHTAAGRWLVKAGPAAVGPLAHVALDETV